MRAVILFAALLLLVNVEGSVLVRFINTVPTRTPQNPGAASVTGRLNSDATGVDRVGLQYFASANSATSSPTIVWTEGLNSFFVGAPVADAPFAWTFAMPPLRQYRDPVSYAGKIDRVAAYLSSQIVSGASTLDPSSDDSYEQTTLKDDGVGLYLSFAAGTYQMQAYAVLGDPVNSNPYAGAIRQLTTSLSSFTFVDGAVYTIVAIGNGAYTASTPTQGSSVNLVLFQESLAPTTFGMASLRWFHAIQTQSTTSINVYTGSNAASNLVASNIAFGALSSYVDVTPSTSLLYPITSSASGTIIAPTTSTKYEVTGDFRAGTRATVICAITDSTNQQVFCRQIPSRVVAYVRLINDLSGQTSLVQGAFGSTTAANALLTLWASYEFPRPDQVVEMSQTVGANIVTGTAATQRGLYGVVSQVASGMCSGYGEVYIPLMIMDHALRFKIIRNNVEFGTTGATGAGYNAASGANIAQLDPVTSNSQWFWGAPIFKRVNFVLKTNGFSTLSGQTSTTVLRVYDLSTTNWFLSTLLLNMYMEPGAYYSLLATPSLTGVSSTFTPVTVQRPTVVSYAWRLDRTVDVVASGVPSGQGLVNWVPFPQQSYGSSVGTITLRQQGSTNVNLVPNIQASTSYFQTAAVAPGITWPAVPSPLTVNAGSYTFSFSPSATTTLPCTNAIPGSTAVTVSAGNIIDFFLLNSFGCMVNNNNQNSLSVYTCMTQSALVTGHANNTLLSPASVATAAPSSTSFFFSAASSTASSFALIFAALIAVFAALL